MWRGLEKCRVSGKPGRSDLEDWRSFRARLVANDRGVEPGELYESPLIETGSVLLGPARWCLRLVVKPSTQGISLRYSCSLR